MAGHLLALLAGYLIGSVSFTRLITARLAPNLCLSDIQVKDEKTGTTYQRPPNATTASMALGWQAGMAISFLDMAKVIVPVILLRRFFPEHTFFLAAAVGALLGNNWPLYYGFAGGSGLSVIYGSLLVIDPLSIPVTVLAGLVLGLFLLRSMLLSFVLPLLFLIPWFWFRTGSSAYMIFTLAMIGGYAVPLVKDIRGYLARGKGEIITERAVMEQMPMGRGMLKMLDKMGLKKER
jgi:acyl phosphate:glycerol-3-phosphate acyltransferase